MVTEEVETPSKKTRREFLKGASASAASVAAILSSACKPRKPETSPAPEPITIQLKNQLESIFATTKENLAVGKVAEQFPGYMVSEGNVPFFCLPARGSDQENPYQVGFLKAGEHVFLNLQVVTIDKESKIKEVWNVLLFNKEQGLPDKWEFVKIGGWDENRMDEQLKKNADYLVGVNGRLALFSFDSSETERINQAPSEPILP